jgi:hypothetical protein
MIIITTIYYAYCFILVACDETNKQTNNNLLTHFMKNTAEREEIFYEMIHK